MYRYVNYFCLKNNIKALILNKKFVNLPFNDNDKLTKLFLAEGRCLLIEEVDIKRNCNILELEVN